MAAKGQATKDRIVKSALRLFHRQGYKQTTIEDICTASGVKRGNLFYYFDNKEEIAHAAIAHAVDRHKAYFDGIKTQDTDPLNKVELMIDGMVEYAVQRGCKACWFFGNFAQELGDSNRSLSYGINRFFLFWNEFLVELFDQANQSGTSAWRIDSDALSRLVISSIEGALLLCKASKDPEALKKTGEALKSVVRLCRESAGQGERSHDYL